MTAKALRGTKRRCQNGTCAEPFYDLNRAGIACPHCGTTYVPVEAPAVSETGYRRSSFRPMLRPVPAALPAEEAEVEALETESEEIADPAEPLLDEDETEEPGAIDTIPAPGIDEE
ncbi:MAG: FYDLN acid domain-containing protein [Hyphomicrobiaceae bacterium]